jgi:uncharacterized protein (TIGR00369 family)
MNASPHYTALPNSGSHNCFACGSANKTGLQMTFYADGESVCSWLTVPDHLCGWNTLVHGGVLTTILDEIMGWTGLYLLEKVTLTRKIEVEFLRPVHVGDRLKAEGTVDHMLSPRRARIEAALYNDQGAPCARARGEFALLTPSLAKRMGMLTEAQIRQFFEPILHLRSRVKKSA